LGAEKESGGYKGYGLGLLVEILSGVLAGSNFGLRQFTLNNVADKQAVNLGHFFCAIDVAAFRDVDEFKRDMDELLRSLKDSAKAPGQERIFVAGEIEHEKYEDSRKNGVPLHDSTAKLVEDMAREYDVPPPW
jgi:LDH2 family malate/lactate/ureidoglycolate dehydrogenase